MPFVAFQQTILRHKVTSTTRDELDTLEEFIGTRFEEETKLRERPWTALEVDGSQSEIDLERQYISEYVGGPPPPPPSSVVRH